MAGHGTCHYVRLVSSAIGVTLGVLASAVFFFMYHHTVASVWAILSAVFAEVCFMLHFLHHRNVLHSWHSPDTLNDIAKLGFVVLNIAMAFTAWYLFDGFYHHRALQPIEDSPYITAVWSFMTGKWGGLLWSCSGMYSRLLSRESSPPLLGERA